MHIGVTAYGYDLRCTNLEQSNQAWNLLLRLLYMAQCLVCRCLRDSSQLGTTEEHKVDGASTNRGLCCKDTMILVIRCKPSDEFSRHCEREVKGKKKNAYVLFSFSG